MKYKSDFLFSKITLLFSIVLFLGSCDKYEFETDTFTDSRDGNVYKTVKIGNQVWMAENLRYLPNVYGRYAIATLSNRYYVYGYDGTNLVEAKATANYKTYGVLYNWVGANAACPAGWHLPTDEEWAQLTAYLGGDTGAGGILKEKGTQHWNSPNTGATNKVEFAALPGGGLFNTFEFTYLGATGFWWTASDDGDSHYYYRYMHDNDKGVVRGYVNMATAFSVRCVKD